MYSPHSLTAKTATDAPQPGLCEVTPLARVRDGFAEVTEVAYRDLRQALVFGLPKDPQGPLTKIIPRHGLFRVTVQRCDFAADRGSMARPVAA